MEPALTGASRQNVFEMRDLRVLTVMGRLKPGVRVGQAAAEAGIISRQLAQAYPKTNATCALVVSTYRQAQMEQNTWRVLFTIFSLALAAVVLLIACANVMNLMLSRASARSREIAVRLAIGAGRGRLIRQLLTESLVIAVSGGALGLIVAQAGADLLSQFRIPSDIPFVLDVKLDPRVLLFALLVSLASSIVFGLAPALRSTKLDLVPALKAGRAADGRRRLRGRSILVVTQVAGSLLLLVFATQALRGARILLSSPAGFRTEHVLLASCNPALARDSMDQTQAFYRRLVGRARNLPHIKSATLSQAVPLLGGGSLRVIPEGVQLPPGTEALSVFSNVVSDGYFNTIGIPVIEGREFLQTDGADSERVAIINEYFARKYYPNQSAIGRWLRLNGPDGPLVRIVGVAKQSKYLVPWESPIENLYLPLAQNPSAGMTLMLETEGPSSDAVVPLRDLVQSLDSRQPIYSVRSIEEVFDLRATKLMAILIETIGALAMLGLVLALVGLYGLMSYSVSLRQREIGIRVAIGADQANVVRMVLNQGIVLASSGVVIGLLLSLAVGKPTAAMVGGRGLNLPLVALVALALLAMAGLGAYIPARRAARVDPNTVLRQE